MPKRSPNASNDDAENHDLGGGVLSAEQRQQLQAASIRDLDAGQNHVEAATLRPARRYRRGQSLTPSTIPCRERRPAPPPANPPPSLA